MAWPKRARLGPASGFEPGHAQHYYYALVFTFYGHASRTRSQYHLYGHEIIHAESLRAYKHAYGPTTAHGYIITHTVPLCCVRSHASRSRSRTRSRYHVHTIISLFGSLLAGSCLYDHRSRNTAFLTLQHTIFTFYGHASRSRSQYHVPDQDIIYAEPLRAFVTVNCLAFVLDFAAADYIASC